MIANAMMAGAIKTITLERGVDPRESTLMMFGGAGGLFATLLASELGVRRVVVPPHPGNFSALGLLGADLVKSHARTRLLQLDDDGLAEASRTLEELFAAFDGAKQTVQEAAVNLRYSGQEHTLTLPVEWDESRVVMESAALVEAFTRSYDSTFGHTMTEPVELVTMRATLRDVLPTPGVLPPAPSGGPSTSGKVVDAYSFVASERTPFAIVARSELGWGASFSGPAIIVEPTSTTYLDAGFSASAHETGALIIEREAA